MLHHEIVSSFLLKFVLKVLLNTKKKHNREEILTVFFRVLNETLNNTKTKKTALRIERREETKKNSLLRVPTNTITRRKSGFEGFI